MDRLPPTATLAPRATAAEAPPLSAYVDLMRRFQDGELQIEEFEQRYSRLFLEDPSFRPEAIEELLNDVFLDVEAYERDPALRGELGIDERRLRAGVREALAALSGM